MKQAAQPFLCKIYTAACHFMPLFLLLRHSLTAFKASECDSRSDGQRVLCDSLSGKRTILLWLLPHPPANLCTMCVHSDRHAGMGRHATVLRLSCAAHVGKVCSTHTHTHTHTHTVDLIFVYLNIPVCNSPALLTSVACSCILAHCTWHNAEM